GEGETSLLGQLGVRLVEVREAGPDLRLVVVGTTGGERGGGRRGGGSGRRGGRPRGLRLLSRVRFRSGVGLRRRRRLRDGCRRGLGRGGSLALGRRRRESCRRLLFDPLDLRAQVARAGERAQHVAELRGAVQAAAQVVAGGAVVEIGGDLLDPEAGGQRVDRQRGLHAPAGGEGLA